MRWLTVWRVTVAIAALVALLRLAAPAPLELIDLKLLDFRHRIRGPLPPGGEVVVVGVDEASLDEVGRWPWPRARLATLVERLTAAGTAVIGFDMVFDQPDLGADLTALQAAVDAAPEGAARAVVRGWAGDQDQRLAAALRASGRVVLGYYVDLRGAAAPGLGDAAARLPELSVRATAGASVADSRFLPAATALHASIPPLLDAAASGGHFNFLPDQDGLYRRLPLGLRVEDRVLSALGLEVARLWVGGASATLGLGPRGVAGVSLSGVALPVDPRGQLWINSLGPPRTIPYVSAADVIAERVPPDRLAGKIALVGFTAAGFDEIATPFAPVQPGVELQATVVENLLHGRALRRPWWLVPSEAALVLLAAVLLGLVLRHQRAAMGAAVAGALLLLYAVGSQLLFIRTGLAVGGLYPIAGIVLATFGGSVFRAATEEREKRFVRTAFRHYLNPEVTDLLARDPSRLRLGGERREITTLFSDIKGFTTISEGLDAHALAELLNEYLNAMTDIVFRHSGLLDKYIGDAVMAFWGAPIDAPDHARRGCMTALDMLDALRDLQTDWKARGLPSIDIRVGLNSGQAAVGNFGSRQRFSYTAVGDSVNLASRLEGLNKAYGSRIMIADDTRRAVGADFICRELDRVRVVGRTQPVAVHELMARRADDADGALARRAEAFETALAAYRTRRWNDAITTLEPLAAASDDAVVGTLLARCRTLRATPPGPEWEAVYEATSK